MRIHKSYPRPSVAITLFLVSIGVCVAQLPEVPAEAIEALGVTAGTPQNNGFVFIEGKYIAPPYTVSRKGNGIFINRVQVEQPIVWTAEVLTPAAVPHPKKSAEEPKKTEPVKPSPFADTPPETPLNAEPAATNEASVAAGEKPAEPAQAGNTLDSLFSDSPAKQPVEGAEKTEPAAEKKAIPVVLTQKQKDELRQKLDIMRQRFELGLARGEIFLFNYRHSRVNGTYGTAKALFAVLPEALRYSQSPQDLMEKLNQGGVYFLDINACTDLFRNRLNFMTISDRRRSIQFNEEKKQQTQLR